MSGINLDPEIVNINEHERKCKDCNKRFTKIRTSQHLKLYHSKLPKNIEQRDNNGKKTLFCTLCINSVKRHDVDYHNQMVHQISPRKELVLDKFL